MEIIPFTVASKRIKYLVINFKKDIQSLYTKNYKSLKEIKDNLNKWKDIPSSWIERQYCQDGSVPQIGL